MSLKLDANVRPSLLVWVNELRQFVGVVNCRICVNDAENYFPEIVGEFCFSSVATQKLVGPYLLLITTVISADLDLTFCT